MSDILASILQQKQVEVAQLNSAELRKLAFASPPPQADFYASIRRANHLTPVRLIAELKRASPSKGLLAPHVDLITIGSQYQANGASAISVLTDEQFFKGSLQTLAGLRSAGISIPLLRKDFIIDDTQLYQTRLYGASAVLLIVAALPEGQLKALHATALELGLTPLVEVHDEGELEVALSISGLRALGVNNRNLRTFEVNLQTTLRLLPAIPKDVASVAESGIFGVADIVQLAQAGIDAILVGEGIITSADIPAKVRELSTVAGQP